MADTNAQIKLAEVLQDRLLKSFDELFKAGAETAADRATLLKMLQTNGWSLDPSRVPQSLKDKLLLADSPVVDEDVVGEIRQVG